MSSPRARRSAALVLAGVALLGACGGGNDGRAEPTRSPTPTFTAGKPGGTLRVVGSTRSVPLDPALARDDASLLVSRLIYRQLYSYRPGDPEPQPDLATGPPALSGDRLTATITLRPARWNTTGGRNVTSGDVLRALKRLCTPTVLAPERGYLSEMVVGYADFCTRASKVRLGAGRQLDVDDVAVPGLRAVGDTQLQIVLRRPAADLRQVLALPALSPLPFEIKDGFPGPTSLINDGPYRFIEPEAGEAYRLSRNSSWDPAGDGIRAALVDRVTFRGGLSAADVEQRLESGEADLSWDVETPPDVLRRMPSSVSTPAASSPSGSPSATAGPSASASPGASGTPSPAPGDTTYSAARVDDRDLALLSVGARGPSARTLGAPGARIALSECIDRSALQTAFGGAGRAMPTAALLTPDYLDVSEADETTPPSTPSVQPSTTGSATPGTGQLPSGAGSTATRRPSTSASPVPGAAGSTTVPAKPLSVAQCRQAFSASGLRSGTPLVLLTADTAVEKAGSAAVQRRLEDAGLSVRVLVVPADRFGAVAGLGGWDLALSVLRPDFTGSRAVLAPLLDPRWPGSRAAGAARRAASWYPDLLSGLAETSPDRTAAAELALASAVASDASFVAVLRLSTVRTTGANVGAIPPLALLGNADPANVALGVTRPGESASPTAAPS